MGRRTISDAELLGRIAVGDDDAFSVLYRRHLDGVIAFFRRRVPTPEVAFDLAAETFAAIVTGADSYAEDGPAVGWIYGIARNKLRESLRRGRVEDEARLRLALEPVVLTDEALERVEERAGRGDGALDAALAELSETIRTPLLARVVDEASYEAIAAALGCSEQVVRQRVHRGLTALRAGLEEGR
ncbi:MAG: sigma-70 family RNA polymerase sigma factor [Solirubrobacteraceae bacterium]|nr:sigma-70 family RNA polymerase sigma factor [Solirubrobacteraceae bacterium]